MKIKHAAGEYSVYIAASFIRAGLFYYISLITAPEEFVFYNSYVFYSDIFATIVGSGTITMFSLRGASERRLSAALIFETSFVLVVLFCFWVKCLIKGNNLDLNLALLFGLTFLRTINLLFSRFYIFFRNIARSNLNDLLGNFSWIPLVFLWRYLGGNQSIESYISIWLIALSIGVGANLWNCRQQLHWEEPVKEWKNFLSVYIRSFHFTIIARMYGTLEKLLFIHSFGINTTTSSYLISSKVTGFAAEMSGGFAQSLAQNQAAKNHDLRSEKRMLTRLIALNLALMFLICAAVVIGSDYLYTALKTQLTRENISLIFWLLPLSIFVQLHGIVSIYLQKHSKLRYLFGASLFQLGILAVLYITRPSLYVFLGVQIAGFLALVVTDLVMYRRLRKRATRNLETVPGIVPPIQ
jgi:hypothetical protein